MTVIIFQIFFTIPAISDYPPFLYFFIRNTIIETTNLIVLDLRPIEIAGIDPIVAKKYRLSPSEKFNSMKEVD